MAIAITLEHYLQDQDIDFDILHHNKTRTSLETASVAHISGNYSEVDTIHNCSVSLSVNCPEQLSCPS